MLEFACACVVAVWLLLRLPQERARPRLLGELAIIGGLAWLTEQTCIQLYDFYAYAPRWSVMLGDVPLLVVLIWPVVIGSARDLLRPVLNDPLQLAAAAGLLILADASFIEPAAVAAGLWSWKQPGVLEVPPAGILGWALYAAIVVYVMERPFKHVRWRLLALAAVAPAVHVALLVAWWGLLRWLNAPVPTALALLGVSLVSLATVLLLLRTRIGGRIPLRSVLMRMPGALFFAGLLFMVEPGPAVLLWAAAFVPPWLVLTVTSARWPLRGTRPG